MTVPVRSVRPYNQLRPIIQAKFDQLCTEVENNELRDLLGAVFLIDIQTDPENYTALLDGTTFTDCRGRNSKHRGLRFVLAYFNFSKYSLYSRFADTYSGMVVKNRQETTTIGELDLKRIQEDARKIALSEWQLIKEYLNINSNDYPLWDCTDSKKVYTPIFKSFRKTFYGGNEKPNTIIRTNGEQRTV